MALTQIGAITKGEILSIDWRGRGSVLLWLDDGDCAVLPSGNLIDGPTRMLELHEGMELEVKVVSTSSRRKGGAFYVVTERLQDPVEMGLIPESTLSTLKVGLRVKGPVTRLGGDGATVQVQGIQALLPYSELGAAKRSSLRIGVSVEATIMRVEDGFVTLTRRVGG